MARKRLPGAQARASRMAKKRFGRDFGRRLIRRLGFGMDDFKKGGFVRKKLGLFGESFSTDSGSAGPGPAPSVEQPERVSNESSPTLTTIVKQLNTLVKAANKVGILTKGQQEALLGQLAESRRISKEQLLEGKRSAPIPEPVEMGGTNSLAPLGDVIDELRKQIDKLTNTVEEKVEEDEDKDSNNRGFFERMADRYDVGDEYRRRRTRRDARNARAARVADRASRTVGGQEYSVNKHGRWTGPGGRFASREVAETLTRQAATGGSASTNIARNIARSATRNSSAARVGGPAIAEAIKRAAKPIIAKGLGSTVLRSIPIIGGIAGVGFAINRLTQGDVVGAGLDLMSGLGGPLTAIPALIASTARDIYSSVFGVQPEADPEVTSRMAMVTSIVEGLVKAQLGQSVEPKNRPTQARAAAAAVPTQQPQQPQRETAAPLGTAAVPPPPPSTLSESLSQFETQTSGGSSSGAAVSSSNEGSTRVESPGQNTGAEVLQSSQQPLPAIIPNMYGFNQQLGRFTPQTSMATKSGHAGIGNVPNPDYIPSGTNNLSTMFNVMFFNLNYQEL